MAAVSSVLRFLPPRAVRLGCFFVVACIFGLAGCGAPDATRETTGKVKYRGKIVTHGSIQFFPSAGRPFGGAIQPDGTYRVRLLPADYRVAIVAGQKTPEGWKEGDPVPTGPPDVPPEYGSVSTSRLQVSVAEGREPLIHDFDLK